PDVGPGWMWGAGMLAMTASDLAKWDISLIRKSLLRPESYRALENDVHLNNGAGTGYGLGVDVGVQNGRFMVEHSGEVSGFTAENIVFPEDSAAVVVLTNQDAAPASSTIAQQIVQALFTTKANAYFSDQALKDFASSLGPLGALTGFVQTRKAERGGMVYRSYRASFPSRTLRVWTYET